MPTTPFHRNPEYERIAAAATRLFEAGVGIRFQDTVFRAVHHAYAKLPDLISGQGSLLKGSRWNTPGAMRVLHASDSPEHSISEALANYRRFGIPVPGDLHIVVRAIHIDIRNVLDLRDGSVRHALRVSEDRMLQANWEYENGMGEESIPQAVGRAVAAAGFCGLLAPSAAEAKATNAVVFVDCLGSRDTVTLEEAE